MASTKSVDSFIKVDLPKPVKTPPPKIRLVLNAKEKVGALKALTAIRKLFGPKGENWIMGNEHKHLDAGDLHPNTGDELTKAFDGFCLIGAVYDVDGRYENAARAAIALAIAERTYEMGKLTVYDEDDYDYDDDNDVEAIADRLTGTDIITSYNDESADWDDIKGVLKRARQLVSSAQAR